MGLFSFFRKNKQRPNSEQSAYHSRSEEERSTVRASRKRKTANDAADPVLPEKKRARRRLVGAVALVLAVVIVLPMVLDSEPKPLADDIAIQIPSHDKPASASASAAASGAASEVSGLDQQEEIIDPASTPAPSANVKPGAANLAAAGVAPVPPLTNNANVAVPTAPEIKPEPKPAAKPKPENKPKAELKQERKPKPEPKSELKSEVKAEEMPDVSQSQDDAARAAAILNGRSDVARPASGKFVIQVAALASQEKVDELRGKLSDAGIRSYTQKIKTSSGERIRIRVGPFASKEEAEKARARLAALGLNGSLVPA